MLRVFTDHESDFQENNLFLKSKKIEIEKIKKEYLFFGIKEKNNMYRHKLDLSDPDKFITRI